MMARPAAGDRVLSFQVSFDEANRAVSILFRYRDPSPERLDPITEGAITIWVGQHSRRIFRIDLPVPMGFSTAELAQKIARDLTSTFERLNSRAHSEHRARQIMNYEEASEGLELQDAPPPWLFEALAQLRDQGSKAY